ncbi:MAG: hypothetical protein NZZ41_00755 [Candidatus Dojkabacteria bacterium]|nr:hypothetical protein [Candidatus Dojkabacteria bacterium]
MKVKTLKGRVIDFSLLLEKNENTLAVTGGGQMMNARGDLLDKNGKIIKTREQLDEEYNKKLDNPVKENYISLSSKDLNRFSQNSSTNIKNSKVSDITQYIDIASEDFEKTLNPNLPSNMDIIEKNIQISEDQNDLSLNEKDKRTRKKLPPPDVIEDDNNI